MTGSSRVSFRLDGRSQSSDELPPLRGKQSAFFDEAVASPMAKMPQQSQTKQLDASHDSGSSSLGGSAPTTPSASEIWRKHGKLYRARIIMEDEENGGNTFLLSGNCRIERYYSVAEKVLRQFLSTRLDANGTSMSSSLREAYLVGNRLVKFLSTVLPTHPDYFKTQPPEYVTFRSKSQAQLVQLLQYLEQIALLIDEDQYNKFILQDLHNRMASSTSLQDITLSSIELASDTSFSSQPPLETNFSQPQPQQQQPSAPPVQRSSWPASDNLHPPAKPQILPQNRPHGGKDHGRGVSPSKGQGGRRDKDHVGRQSEPPRQARGIDLKMQQQYQSTSWDTSFSRYHGQHEPPQQQQTQPHKQQTQQQQQQQRNSKLDSLSYSEDTRRSSKSHSRKVRLEGWNPQFPPLDDFKETIAYVGDSYGQQACSATTATTTTTSSSNSSAASSSVHPPTTKIEQRWIEAQRQTFSGSLDDGDSVSDVDDNEEALRPNTVKELRPWHSTLSSERHHPLLQQKNKNCWPAPAKKTISYYSTREGAEDDEEVEFDDEEVCLAGIPRPGEDEASLTSGATFPHAHNHNNSQKSRRSGVLKQFKGCVNCLVN